MLKALTTSHGGTRNASERPLRRYDLQHGPSGGELMSEFQFVVKTVTSAIVEDALGVVIVVALVVAIRFVVHKYSE